MSVEPRLRLSRESAAISASVLAHSALAGLALLLAARVAWQGPGYWLAAGQVLLELGLAGLVFGRLLPQLMLARLTGVWVRRLRVLFQLLFYCALPVTLLISLVLSIVNLAEPELREEDRDQSEAVDALLEAGEEEGILEVSDRELVRSVVEFGDKVVREVMTPRPDVFAVPASMSLEEFTVEVNRHALSRVPVYQDNLDNITGVAFARDLLGVQDADAAQLTVASLARHAHFVPESKKVKRAPARDAARQATHEHRYRRIRRRCRPGHDRGPAGSHCGQYRGRARHGERRPGGGRGRDLCDPGLLRSGPAAGAVCAANPGGGGSWRIATRSWRRIPPSSGCRRC